MNQRARVFQSVDEADGWLTENADKIEVISVRVATSGQAVARNNAIAVVFRWLYSDGEKHGA